MIHADFHVHSWYSRGDILLYDGLYSPKIIVKYAKKIGLNCIALTDHDTTAGLKEAKEIGKKIGVTVMPGIEIAQKYGRRWWERKHVIGLGIEETPKKSLYEKSVEEICEWIKYKGGLTYTPHPYSFYGIKNAVKENYIDLIETFNSNCTPLVNLRASIAAKKYKKPFAAGSDSHTVETLGNVVNFLDSNEKEEDILEALLKKKNKIIRKRTTNILQFKRLEVERYKRNIDAASGYIIEKLPKALKSYHLSFLSSPLRAFGLKLLHSSIENDVKTNIFWSFVVPLVYAEDTIYNLFGLIKDLT